MRRTGYPRTFCEKQDENEIDPRIEGEVIVGDLTEISRPCSASKFLNHPETEFYHKDARARPLDEFDHISLYI